MNKIYAKVNERGELCYKLVTSGGDEFDCQRWFEKKTDKWHVKLPAGNPTGRTYISESLLTNDTEDGAPCYEFPDKTTGPRVLGPSGGWRSKMTADERQQVEFAEQTIESIKRVASERTVILTAEEKLQREIEKQERKLEELRAKLSE